MTRKPPTTAATLALSRLGIPFTAHPYEHDPAVSGFGEEAVQALGVPAERVFKTLVVEADGALVVAVVPVSTTLDLKSLATAVGAKRAVMADPDLAERRTGFVLGGISPVGQRTRLPLLLDASAQRLPTVFVSGGRRGFDIELTPADLLRATDGTCAEIGR